MRCPFCASPDSKVVDSRDSETGEAVRRRRQCLACHKRFTTYERVETVPLYVLKKDGRREEFDRGKLLGGLVMATTKRDISRATLEALAEEVESAIRSRNVVEVSSREIGAEVMERLRGLDEIAYVRFASVYREFKDVEDMRGAIEEMLTRPPGARPGQPPRRGRRRDGAEEELSLDLGR